MESYYELLLRHQHSLHVMDLIITVSSSWNLHGFVLVLTHLDDVNRPAPQKPPETNTPNAPPPEKKKSECNDSAVTRNKQLVGRTLHILTLLPKRLTLALQTRRLTCLLFDFAPRIRTTKMKKTWRLPPPTMPSSFCSAQM